MQCLSISQPLSTNQIWPVWKSNICAKSITLVSQSDLSNVKVQYLCKHSVTTKQIWLPWKRSICVKHSSLLPNRPVRCESTIFVQNPPHHSTRFACSDNLLTAQNRSCISQPDLTVVKFQRLCKTQPLSPKWPEPPSTAIHISEQRQSSRPYWYFTKPLICLELRAICAYNTSTLEAFKFACHWTN